MFKVVALKALPERRLWLRYSDGVEGVADLSHLAGKGVFRAWESPGVFESASIESGGEIRWGDAIDLCPDALCLQVTRKATEDVFPNLTKAAVDARS
jgi:Protein of unknown function (DUF2442)